MSELRYGATLCDGVKSAVNPARPCIVCVECERRLTQPAHVWQKYLNPPPAVHDGERWSCDKRVSLVPA